MLVPVPMDLWQRICRAVALFWLTFARPDGSMTEQLPSSHSVTAPPAQGQGWPEPIQKEFYVVARLGSTPMVPTSSSR